MSDVRATTRAEQSAAVKTIGARMREARELCNLSQGVAAKRLGYSNPSKLSKVEGATDTNSVPLWLIKRAARVYEVSIDYLFGDTDDWEVGSRMVRERETSAWLFEAWEKSRRREMDALRKLHDKVEAMEEAIAIMLTASDEAVAALDRFVEVNPEFEEMRAGSRLVGSVTRASDAAKSAKAKMVRFRMDCTVAAVETNQLSLMI
jgi:hypothetical protein